MVSKQHKISFQSMVLVKSTHNKLQWCMIEGSKKLLNINYFDSLRKVETLCAK